MSTPPSASDAVSPHSPVYAFNEAGQPIVLHDGPFGGLTPHNARGVVEFLCAPEPRVVWRVQDRSVIGVAGNSVTLVLRRPDGDASVTGVWRSKHDEWSNGAVIGQVDAPLKRVVAHWFNLPDFHGPIALTRSTEAGEHWWVGRWKMDVGGWKLTFDVRPDHARVWRNLHEGHVYVMTHVMELDVDQLGALGRLGAAFGLVEVIEVVGHDQVVSHAPEADGEGHRGAWRGWWTRGG